MKIIFLDIDGVMVANYYSQFETQMRKISKSPLSLTNYGNYFTPYSIENLLTLLKTTEAKIVFSSSWKDKGVRFLTEMFVNRYNFKHSWFLDCTPNIDINKRGLEIKTWIENNPSYTIEKYVIIDDMGETFFEKEQLSNLVICDSSLGFTSKELVKTLEILR